MPTYTDIGPCECCGDESTSGSVQDCLECSNASTLSVTGPGGSGTLTIDAGDPNTAPNEWHGFIGACEVLVRCTEPGVEYTAFFGSITCALAVEMPVIVDSCVPLMLRIQVDNCCSIGEWVVTE